jgi:hypothetical protein
MKEMTTRNLTESLRQSAAVTLMLIFAALFVSFAGQHAAAAVQSAQPDLRGIYVYTNDVSQISNATADAVTASLSVPGVDGIVLVIGWNSIEPAMGQYQWTTLDHWMNLAISLGKRIDLTVPAGSDTPAWMFQSAPVGAGAQALNFTISPHNGATGGCDAETIAAPWDSAFLSQWDAMLAALAAHLKSAGTYNAVTLLRLTGINRTTDELRLPEETAQSTGLACVSDAITTWQQAGYRPSLLLQGWTAITNSFQKSFPDKSYSLALIPLVGFPPIAEDGSIINGNMPDRNQPLLNLASQKFPGHLVIQFNFLMPGVLPEPEVIQAAQSLQTMAAFQTNNYFGSTGQGAACSEPVTNPTPCTLATYLQLLETGIYPLGTGNSLRAQYIEVFQANANAFPADILQAHAELFANPIDDPSVFIRQQYLDFLGREPDAAGLAYWTGQITQCGTDQTCIDNERIDASDAFFFEPEFQQTGAYVFRLYREAYGINQPFPNPDSSNLLEAHKLPSYAVFSQDRAQVVGGTDLAQSQLNFANVFVQRPEFLARYPASLNGSAFVDAMLATVNDLGVDLSSQRAGLITAFNSGGRAGVAFRIADDDAQGNTINNRALIDEEYNRTFVATEYFGFLLRDADIGGFLFWLGQVNSGPLRDTTKQHAMVCSFITSTEYQQRFSLTVSHTNAECH